MFHETSRARFTQRAPRRQTETGLRSPAAFSTMHPAAPVFILRCGGPAAAAMWDSHARLFVFCSEINNLSASTPSARPNPCSPETDGTRSHFHSARSGLRHIAKRPAAETDFCKSNPTTPKCGRSIKHSQSRTRPPPAVTPRLPLTPSYCTACGLLECEFPQSWPCQPPLLRLYNLLCGLSVSPSAAPIPLW